jgi:predicted nucleic acid-binding protein
VILADTSIWIDHFRAADARLGELLLAHSVAVHPVIIGEIACGSIARRATVIRLLRALPCLDPRPIDEVLGLIEHRALFGRGLGWGDVSILASAANAGVALWTRDRPLAEAAERLGVRARE